MFAVSIDKLVTAAWATSGGQSAYRRICFTINDYDQVRGSRRLALLNLIINENSAFVKQWRLLGLELSAWFRIHLEFTNTNLILTMSAHVKFTWNSVVADTAKTIQFKVTQGT